MAYDVGDIATFTLTVTPFDGTTAATVTVKAPDGTVTAATPTPSGGGTTWTARVPLTAAGAWYIGWTVTGTGAGVQWDTAVVEPVPPYTDQQRQVRLLIADTDPANRFFSTGELTDFLALNALSVRRAAAQALDVWAANEAMVSKKITTQDLQTDGPAVAASLRQSATELRRQADAGEGDDGTDGFEIIEYRPYPYHAGWRI
jgi:hypothetical protein